MSPLADFDSSSGSLRLLFKRPGFLEARPIFLVGRARVCRSCLAVVPFLDQRHRQELAEKWDELIPVAPDPTPETPPSPGSPS
ncbi:hypothetical protein [Amycolatopsis sp. Hca4]|uniref:hypothetical protein n=1 Tax=Amycolatopsis sp. Hca4 TaxID=2742131 RepID=UPI0015918235|nr:hypothetical protein [Amycolatopsis sp. Hca4]QKV78575.1 hypothetical protein HUT10_35930 [Amycolatopsis sp. Hca4]